MTDEPKQTLNFICGYLIYSKGKNKVLAIKADHISSIEYQKDEKEASSINISGKDIETSLATEATTKETVFIVAHNGVKLEFSCTKEKFDEIMEGIFALHNEKPSILPVEIN